MIYNDEVFVPVVRAVSLLEGRYTLIVGCKPKWWSTYIEEGLSSDDLAGLPDDHPLECGEPIYPNLQLWVLDADDYVIRPYFAYLHQHFPQETSEEVDIERLLYGQFSTYGRRLYKYNTFLTQERQRPTWTLLGQPCPAKTTVAVYHLEGSGNERMNGHPVVPGLYLRVTNVESKPPLVASGLELVVRPSNQPSAVHYVSADLTGPVQPEDGVYVEKIPFGLILEAVFDPEWLAGRIGDLLEEYPEILRDECGFAPEDFASYEGTVTTSQGTAHFAS